MFDVVLLLSSFSANPDLCHRSGNSNCLLCGLIPFFFHSGGGQETNLHGRKSHDKIGGKEMFYILLLHLILNCVCLFVRLFFGCFFNRFLFLSFFFHLFCDNFPCSGMFQNVPECSGMFHVPDFVDARYGP